MSLICFESVSKLYPMEGETVYALREVDLSIEQGEYIAIVGPSGSGKSTMMNIIGCLDVPSSGRYLLIEKPVESMSEDALAEVRNRQIGFVFQSFHLLPRLTAVENVALPLIYRGTSPADRRTEALNRLRQVGLEDRGGHRPNQLSGGRSSASPSPARWSRTHP